MVQKKKILDALSNCLKTVDIAGLGEKHQGKVRDFYVLKDRRVIVTTDRQSAFDVVLGHIPYKGAVLNQLAAFWFEKTGHIVRNHVIAVPDPNVTVAHNLESIPVEMVVRGYITGVTDTSLWGSYEKGERVIYGLEFPDGLRKNEKLERPVITPTTHAVAGTHDARLTRTEILGGGIVEKKLYEQMEEVAYGLFEFGQRFCKEKGVILADCKYEFGLLDGELVLMDEIHTPDSSRFWIAESYESRFGEGLEPESYDKEFLRRWYIDHGYSGHGKPPEMPEELAVELASLYIKVYEKITGKDFEFFEYPVEERINKNVKEFLEK